MVQAKNAIHQAICPFTLRTTDSKGNTAIQVAHQTGVERWTQTDKRNESRIYENGTLRNLYEKHHMLPPFEDHLLVGPSRVVLNQPTGQGGMAICKDMTFPSFGRACGQDQVALMAVPAWDSRTMDGTAIELQLSELWETVTAWFALPGMEY